MSGTALVRVAAGASGAPRRRAVVPLVGGVVTLLALVGVLGLAALRTVVHACVDVEGPLAVLGVRVTLLQDAADCPTGLALGPGATHGAVLALGLVVPVVLLHALLGALGLGLIALLLHAAAPVRAVLGAVVHALPRPVAGRPVAAARPAPLPLAAAPRPGVLARALHPHRGPPAALA